MNKLKWKYLSKHRAYRTGKTKIVKAGTNLYALVLKDALGFSISFYTKRLKTAKQIAELIEGEKWKRK
jgi:hypothetical protein